MATLTSTLSCTHRILLRNLVPIKLFSPSSSSFRSFSLRPNIKHLACKPLTKCSFDNREYHDSTGGYPKPQEIQWKKEICNSVQLIGTVGLPVQLNHLNSGKVVASTRIAVWKSATDTSWINLTFWNEMAHIAHQHVEKGHQIYVSGRLVSETIEGEEGKQQTYYKVVVQQLNFVERNNPSPVALYDGNSSSMASVGKSESSSAPKLSTEELWQAFFANPGDWWDNRNNKRNPKAPDFKHKDTGEALWVEGRYSPPWVMSQLEILDSKMRSRQHQADGGVSKYLNGGY